MLSHIHAACSLLTDSVPENEHGEGRYILYNQQYAIVVPLLRHSAYASG